MTVAAVELLGLLWDQQAVSLRLGGNLSGIEARAVLTSGVVGPFAPVVLAFAWAKLGDVPLILGRVNFFDLFDVCFFGHRKVFDVKPRP